MSSGFSKYDCIETTQSIYCYPNTNILKNKAGITDSKLLSEYEANVTTARLYMLEDTPIKGRFTSSHLKSIHKYIFQDIYPFAGKFRLEDIWKEDTFFCKSKYIVGNLKLILDRLKSENYLRGLSSVELSNRAAFFMSEINMIHPFREGNGRVIREFIRCLALGAGLELNWSRVNSKELLKSTILAANGSLESLEKCLHQTIVRK